MAYIIKSSLNVVLHFIVQQCDGNLWALHINKGRNAWWWTLILKIQGMANGKSRLIVFILMHSVHINTAKDVMSNKSPFQRRAHAAR